MLILQILLDASLGSPCKVAPLEMIGTNSIYKFSKLQTLDIRYYSSALSVYLWTKEEHFPVSDITFSGETPQQATKNVNKRQCHANYYANVLLVVN